MSKFVVLDHWLRYVGGHEFEYDTHLLASAERHGWQPVLVAHRQFDQRDKLPMDWEVHCPFRDCNDLYKNILCSLKRTRARLADARLKRAFFDACSYRLRIWRRLGRYRRLERNFSAALDEIWSRCRLGPGDLVFLPTATPFDLAAVAAWAKTNPSARDVDWHFQFHWSPETEAWYSHPTRQPAELLPWDPEILRPLSEVVPPNRLHLYATTKALAGQLEYCLGTPVEVLPYAVNSAFSTLRCGRPAGEPLRATCPGKSRSDKRPEYSSQIVAALSDYIAAGRVQIAMQFSSPSDVPTQLRELIANSASSSDGLVTRPPLVCAKWPLQSQEYLKLIAESDIGLLPYDPQVYHSMLSAVLVEMLSAGIPVVVPAGCWLADQVSQSIFAHQEGLREKLPVVATLTAAQLEWKTAPGNIAKSGIRIGVDAPGSLVAAGAAEAAVPAGSNYLLLLFGRDPPNLWNRYCTVSIRRRDAQGHATLHREIIGCRRSGHWSTMMVPLDGQCRHIEIELQTAFGREPIVLRQLECCFLAAPGEPPPLGAVGRIAGDPQQFADCLREIVDHFEHYAANRPIVRRALGSAALVRSHREHSHRADFTDRQRPRRLCLGHDRSIVAVSDPGIFKRDAIRQNALRALNRPGRGAAIEQCWRASIRWLGS